MVSWRLLTLGACLALTSCTGYYLSSNLNTWAIGQPKDVFLQRYPQGSCGWECAIRGFELRAAQRQSDGSLVEVGTLTLSPDGYADPVEYWLLFVDAELVQWGQPQDWRDVAARYEIAFNPVPAVGNR